jgi:hypothetical protein
VHNFSDNIYSKFKSRSQKIGLRFSLKNVIDENYGMIPERHKLSLMAGMEKYIEYINSQNKSCEAAK